MIEIDGSGMRFDAQYAFVELRRLIRFGGIGVVSLLVYSSLFALLAETTRLGAVLISMVAYATSMVLSFIGHRYFTFRATGNIRAQIFKFTALHCLCFLTTVAITTLVIDILRWPYVVAILLVDVIVPLITFVALKLVVFREKSTNIVRST